MKVDYLNDLLQEIEHDESLTVEGGSWFGFDTGGNGWLNNVADFLFPRPGGGGGAGGCQFFSK